MFSDKNKIDETSGLSFIVICDNKIILFYEQNFKNTIPISGSSLRFINLPGMAPPVHHLF